MNRICQTGRPSITNNNVTISLGSSFFLPKNVKEFLLDINSYLPDPSCGAGTKSWQSGTESQPFFTIRLPRWAFCQRQYSNCCGNNFLTVVEIISLRGMDSRETMWGEISRGEIFDGRCNWIEWLSSEIFDRRMFSNIWLDISYNQIFGYLRMFLNIFTLLYASLSVIDWWCWTAGLKRQRWHHRDEV